MRELQRLAADDRAIEGLPIRLVIALVVGVASLSVMMGMISDLNGIGNNEVDVRPHPEYITDETGQEVTVTVVDSEGEPVADARVFVDGKTANIDGIKTAKTNEDGNATVTVSPTLGFNQDRGSLEIDVKPPATGEYTDDRKNTEVTVLESEDGS